MHVALGGCLSGADVRFGATEDTGGHLAYVLGASAAQARRGDVDRVDIVTRAFRDPHLGEVYAQPVTEIDGKRRILRLRGDRDDYLEKDDLAAELPALTRSFLDLLRGGKRPDIIHAHFADAAELTIAARRAFGIPFLYTAHSLALQKAGPGATAAARIQRERAAIKSADAIIASSQDEVECQIGAYQADATGRAWRVPPGVRVDRNAGPDRARTLVAPFLRDRDKPIILAVARPVLKKNLGVLVDAFGGLHDLQKAANLVLLAGQRYCIGGRSSETERVTTDLFDRVDRLGLWGRVALPRSHSAEDVQSLYAVAANGGVFANPARHEPFGLTIVEAAQHGVPIVATCKGGPPEILEQIGYGHSIDPDDAAGLAEACLSLLNDPNRAVHADSARREAVKLFDWDAWADRVSHIVQQLTRPATRRAVVEGRPRRLLVSDMDGTLTGDRQGAARFRTALADRPDMGFVVATGRSISEARLVLTDWDLPMPRWIIASVGTEIWHRDSAGAYRRDQAFAERIVQGWQPDLIRAVLTSAGARMQPAYTQRAAKVSAFGDPAEARRISGLLRDKGVRARMIASHERFIDILPVTAGKARAAAWLTRHLGLGSVDCIAAGDSGNDRDLLLWAGAAILPSNALPELDGIEGPGILRTRAAHADGVVEGLTALAVPSLGGAPRSVAAE
ncbi:MAG: HAD-IIB family hydrolase [Paracoccaceae bacterium]